MSSQSRLGDHREIVDAAAQPFDGLTAADDGREQARGELARSPCCRDRSLRSGVQLEYADHAASVHEREEKGFSAAALREEARRLVGRRAVFAVRGQRDRLATTHDDLECMRRGLGGLGGGWPPLPQRGQKSVRAGAIEDGAVQAGLGAESLDRVAHERLGVETGSASRDGVVGCGRDGLPRATRVADAGRRRHPGGRGGREAVLPWRRDAGFGGHERRCLLGHELRELDVRAAEGTRFALLDELEDADDLAADVEWKRERGVRASPQIRLLVTRLDQAAAVEIGDHQSPAGSQHLGRDGRGIRPRCTIPGRRVGVEGAPFGNATEAIALGEKDAAG